MIKYQAEISGGYHDGARLSLERVGRREHKIERRFLHGSGIFPRCLESNRPSNTDLPRRVVKESASIIIVTGGPLRAAFSRGLRTAGQLFVAFSTGDCSPDVGRPANRFRDVRALKLLKVFPHPMQIRKERISSPRDIIPILWF